MLSFDGGLPTARRILPSPPKNLPLVAFRNGIQQPLDDVVDLDALGFGVESRNEPVAEDGQRQRRDVIGSDMKAASENRSDFRGED